MERRAIVLIGDLGYPLSSKKSPNSRSENGSFFVCWSSRSIPLQEIRVDGILEQRSIASHDGQPRGGHEIPALVLDRIVADHRSFGNLHIAINDRSPDAAMTADIDVREDDAGIHLRVGV